MMCAATISRGPCTNLEASAFAQVDGRELGVHAAEVAQRREAIAQIFAGQAEPLECLGGRGFERLLGQVRRVHGQVHVGVDEPRTDRAFRQVDASSNTAPHQHRRAHGRELPAQQAASRLPSSRR
jgi:hypothetical protein